MITTTEALRAVPQGIREGAFAVGATRWETVRNHVLPRLARHFDRHRDLARPRGRRGRPLILVGAVTGFLNIGDASTWSGCGGRSPPSRS